MRVLIIQPKIRSNVKLYGKAYMSQLTLPVIASQIPKEHDIKIVDENVEYLDLNQDADLVCITAMTPAATRAYEIADTFKKKGAKVLMGGVHVSSMPEEASEYADSVVIGESEGLFPLIFEDLNNGGLKSVYKLEKRPDLKAFAHPRHDLMNNKAYVNIPKVETSRGCPFTCEFCSTTTFFGNKMRYRPVNEVVEEVKKLDVDFVFFTDNNIIGNIRYAKELFRELSPLGIKWMSQCSVNFAKDEELLKLAADSGCVGMLVGFESLSDSAIKATGKKINRVEEYAKIIKKIHKYGIGLIGCFVFGFDEDDGKVFKNTLKFIRKTNIEIPQITVLTPFPGTKLRERLLEEGRVLHNDWQYYDATSVVFQPKYFTVKEFRDRYDWVAKRIYNIPSLIWRAFKSFLIYRSFTKTLIFWQVNIVYRRLWKASLETPKTK